MASTFVSYKGRDVQVPEVPLICIGYMLFYEAREHADTPDDKAHFEQMNREWKLRTVGVGCTDLGLDKLLQGDPQKEAEFLSFVNLVRDRLRSFHDTLPPKYSDQVIAVGIPEYKGKPIASPYFHTILEVIEVLIRGEPILPVDYGMKVVGSGTKT